MPTTFQQVFSALGSRHSNPIQRHLPMINSVTSSASGFMYEVNQMRRKKKLMSWFKSIPELVAFVTKIARDVTSKYHFEPVNKTQSGRNKVMKANKFAMQNKIKKIMFQQLVDLLVTGDGYGWMGKLLDTQVKDNIRKAYAKCVPIELKAYEDIYVEKLFKDLKHEEYKATTDLGSINDIDEDLLIPRKYRYVPSSTVENIHDEYDFKHYNHLVGGRQVIFQPDEMIRFTLMDVDGKPNGFTNVESMIVQLELLRFMWLNMLSIGQNGGMPDKMIIVKDLDANNPSFKRMEETLQKYKLVENKHGNMLFTGDIKIEDIRSIEDMQFKDLGLYVTGVLAMQWGISKEDIPFIVGGANTKGESGGGPSDKYYDVIDNFQDTFSIDQNTQMWIPYFGVKIVFDNPNIQRNIRIQTARMNQLSNLTTENELWLKAGKQLTDSTLMHELGRDESDLEKASPEQMMQQNGGAPAGAIGTQNQPSNNLKSPKAQNQSDKKRLEQSQVIVNRGSKPTGVGKEKDKLNLNFKEFDDNADIELKQMMGSDAEDVDLNMFIKLYNEDKAYQSGKPPRVFMRQNDMFTSFKFKSSDYSYKVVIPNDSLEDNKIQLMSLDKIYKV